MEVCRPDHEPEFSSAVSCRSDVQQSSIANLERTNFAAGQANLNTTQPFLPDFASELKHLLGTSHKPEGAGGRAEEAFLDPLLVDLFLRPTPPPQSWDPFADCHINQFASNIEVVEKSKIRKCSYLQKEKRNANCCSKEQSPSLSIGNLPSQHLSGSSDDRTTCPNPCSEQHTASIYATTAMEEVTPCQTARPKESLVFPSSSTPPLRPGHNSQDSAAAKPSQPPSAHCHNIEASQKWTMARTPFCWRNERRQPSRLSNIHQTHLHSERHRKFLQHVRGRCLNCLSANHRVATCRSRTRCWRCLNEGHRSFSCPERRPHLHNGQFEDNDRNFHWRGPVDNFNSSPRCDHGRGILQGTLPHTSPCSPPFMCTRVHDNTSSASVQENNHVYNSKKTTKRKHVTFAMPLFEVCNDHTPTHINDSSFLFQCTSTAPDQSIFSCDPMLFESIIAVSPEAAPCSPPSSPSVLVESRILEMLEAAVDCEWFSPTECATLTKEGDQVNRRDSKEVPLSIQKGTTVNVHEEERTADHAAVSPPPLEDITEHCVAPQTKEKRDVLQELLVYRRRKKSSSLSEEPETHQSSGSIMVPTSLIQQEAHVEAMPPCNMSSGLEDIEQAQETQSPARNELESAITVTPIKSAITPSPSEQLLGDITNIDQFISHITLPVSPPLLQSQPNLTQNQAAEQIETFTRTEIEPMQDSQRKSSRLAEKAKKTLGKNSMQIAQEAIAKKLGDLPSSEDTSNSDEFNRLAQHLDRPLTKQNMEALKVLIEHGPPRKVKTARTRAT